MSSTTKDTIIRTLQTRGKCTVKELAEAADVSPVSIRHHLSNLQVDGMIDVEEVRHGVGRPHHLFFLTENALELFPARYYRLTNLILKEIKGSMPDEKVEDLLSSVAKTLAEEYSPHFNGLSVDERIQKLRAFLIEEGFEVEISKEGEKIIIQEISCPYYHVGQSHPEVCTIDQTLIARAFQVPVDRVTCLLDGDTFCKFEVHLNKPSEHA
jgi:predicted ArsR family transcriptional regulator